MKDQFLAFIAERFQFAVGAAAEAFARAAGKKAATTPDAVEALAAPVAEALRDSVAAGVPSTRAEDERLGPMADQVKDKAKETGQEALERGKQVAQETAQSAKDTAQQAGQEHAEQLKESAAQGARDAAPSS